MFKNLRNDQSLDDAIALLKSESHPEVLSESSRAAIFELARRPLGGIESLSFLFPRAQKLVTAVSFPLVVTVALLFSLPSSLGPERHTAKLLASKDDGNVVFTVANGRSHHRVFKSTDPTRFGAKEVQAVEGRFLDHADNGIELVFYRVE